MRVHLSGSVAECGASDTQPQHVTNRGQQLHATGRQDETLPTKVATICTNCDPYAWKHSFIYTIIMLAC